MLFSRRHEELPPTCKHAFSRPTSPPRQRGFLRGWGARPGPDHTEAWGRPAACDPHACAHPASHAGPAAQELWAGDAFPGAEGTGDRRGQRAGNGQGKDPQPAPHGVSSNARVLRGCVVGRASRGPSRTLIVTWTGGLCPEAGAPTRGSLGTRPAQFLRKGLAPSRLGPVRAHMTPPGGGPATASSSRNREPLAAKPGSTVMGPQALCSARSWTCTGEAGAWLPVQSPGAPL